MTEYGRGRSRKAKIHLRDPELATASACGSGGLPQCVTADVAQIIDCRRCQAVLARRAASPPALELTKYRRQILAGAFYDAAGRYNVAVGTEGRRRVGLCYDRAARDLVAAGYLTASYSGTTFRRIAGGVTALYESTDYTITEAGRAALAQASGINRTLVGR